MKYKSSFFATHKYVFGLFLSMLFTAMGYGQYSLNGPSPVPVSQTRTYTISGPGITNTHWTVSSGVTITLSSNTSITVRFTSTGTKTISASILGADWNAYSASKNVSVTENPPSNPGNPTLVSNNCGQITLQRSGNPPSGTTWYWQGTNSNGTSTSLGSGSTYTTTSSGTFYIRARKNSTGTWSTGSGSLSVSRVNFLPGTISYSGQTSLCYGGNPLQLNNYSSASGGSGGYTYQWQYQDSGSSTWNNISGATGTTYNPGNMYNTRSYRRRVTSCSGQQKYTNVITISIYPNLTAGGASGPSAVCYNQPATLSSTGSASGGNGSIAYQWEHRNLSGGSWSQISGAMGVSYTTGSLTVSKQYRRRAISCSQTVYTNNIDVVVRPQLLAGDINGAQTVCSGDNPGVLGSTTAASGGYGGISYQWQYATGSGGPWSDVGGATSATYDPGALTSSRWYRREATSCSQTVHTTSVAVTVNTPTTWYADTDLDGFGDPGNTTSSCTKPTNYVSNNLDACPSIYGVYNGCGYAAPAPSDENYVYVRNFQKAVNSATNPALITSDADVIEEINYFDGLGRPLQNIAIKASGTGAVRNVSEWVMDWTPGSGGTSFFQQNGSTSENEREVGTNPLGKQELLWKCGNDSSSGPDGGWNTDYFNVDKTATYRYTVWVKRTHSQDGKTWHGTQNVNNLDGTANGNPYFWHGDLPQLDQWYLMVGIIHPHSHGTTDTGVSGVYDLQGNKVIDGTEFKWRSDTTTSRFRNYLYYATDTSVRQYFWNPTLQKVDGSEAPLSSLAQQNLPFDIITQFHYDDYGRQADEFLPYCEPSGTLGAHRGDMATATRDFYETHYKSDFPTLTGGNVNAHAEKEFEASPLNRVLKQAAPGEAWRMSGGATIDFDYNTNGSTEVRKFSVSLSFANNTHTPSLVQSGHYGQYELYKNITYDENYPGTGTDHTTEEFMDKDGRVVLKRTYNAGAHDTYYVYDEYGNLTYVLPPKVTTSSVSSTELNELCYQYKYDHRNRLVEKKLPGKGWEYIVYNALDQPIMTQDAEQELDDEWLFTKYDPFGRVAFTGMVSSTDDRSTHQTAADIEADQYESRRSAAINYETGTLVPVFYSNDAYPNTGIDKIYTINYYDDYLNPTDMDNLDVPSTVLGEPKATNVTGLPTVSKVRVLDTSHWITTITGYDQKGRAIYTASKNNYLSTTDVVESELDFPGKVLQTKATHTKGANPAIVTIDDFTYDHMGRVLKQTQTLGGQTETLVENAYDELGQLVQKNVGGGLQNVDYDYNVRGWLKQINDPSSLGNDLFAFGINYNTVGHGGTALLNGNIAETEWKTANDNTLRWYRYGYDALNRITSATAYSSNYNVSAITYDKNGNLETLTRRGHTNSGATSFGNMDVLDYDYDLGNKLTKVTDTGNGTYGFADGVNQTTEYTYDDNGNMETDTNKGITGITYNHLNLPTNISINGAGGSGNITYIYDATGVKLKKTVGSSVTEYAGNHIYENGTLQFFNQPEGYVTPNGGGGYDYVYQYKDHLGNVRLSYLDNGSATEIVEESNYYPFGLKHKGYNTAISANGNSVAQKWKFNGKELEEDLGLNWLDYGARSYMHDLGRWTSIDPHADSYFSATPYSSFANNPISFVDPTGEDIKFFQWVANEELSTGGEWKEVSFDQLDSNIQKGLENFAKTKEGFALFSKFANKGDKIGSVEFGSTGEYANHNLGFGEFANQGSPEGFTDDPINHSVFGPVREGKTNDYIDFFIGLNSKISNSFDINFAETVGHEVFGHLEQYLDDYIKAFEESGANAANAVFSEYRKKNERGYQDHFDLAGGKVQRYNTFVTQLKAIFNPAQVQKHVNAEMKKTLKAAKAQKAKSND
ncbi:RHS repeat domain-containing protein [Flagellimonas allohymeniacidonis]|uniref:DUF6443 domain-containing protein n=1 Tax=Flagellimonas allohymeniacidonis TaxID=2517819 RepID=A0A4Q8QF62_9FLAO|nr:DUF6443 domain-containing protein [Allomuricauda hymeniacidonis]TAI48484.1 hypothetical protein EW142_01380 [Allomuricauda hymeniacidonis]